MTSIEEWGYLRHLVMSGGGDRYRNEVAQLHSDGFIDEAECQRRIRLLSDAIDELPTTEEST